MPVALSAMIVGLAGLLIWFGNPAVAFLIGAAIAITGGAKGLTDTRTIGRYSLQTGIVLLGLGIQGEQLLRISSDYTWVVAGYVLCVAALGLLGYRLLNLPKRQGLLVTAGSAICGGTAVVTLSPIINAKPMETGAVLGLIFTMNAVALLTFPAIGQFLDLSQAQFGIWSALAIHDTASVVATAQLYGDEAAQIATTLKLGRTLWLIPTALLLSVIYRRKGRGIGLPPFVLLFVIASIMGSLISLPPLVLVSAAWLSKALLVLALFIIGLEISLATLRSIQPKLFVFATGLWCLVAPSALFLVITLVP